MRTLVLGIGNLLLGDEGAGCRFIEELENRYYLPPEVACLDGGAAGFELLPMVEDADTLMIVDAVADGRPPGTLVVAEDDAVPRAMHNRPSPHQIGICEVLATAQMMGHLPGRLMLFGIEPKTIDLKMELSPEVGRAVEKALDAVVGVLRDLGHDVQTRGKRTLEKL